MRTWLANRKHVPAGLRETLESGRSKWRSKSFLSPSSGLESPRGANEALKRLEQAEAQSFDALQAAISSGDAAEIRFSREGWLKISESLRRYDLAIEQPRRDAGELIPRVDIEKTLEWLAFWIRIIGLRLATRLAWDFDRERPDQTAMEQTLAESFKEDLLAAVVALRSNPKFERIFPEWACKALIEDLRRNSWGPEPTDQYFADYVRVVQEVAATCVAKRVSDETGKPVGREPENESENETTNVGRE